MLTGGLLGMTAIARSQFLLFVPLALLVLVLAWRRAAVSVLPLSVVGLVAGVVLVIAPGDGAQLASFRASSCRSPVAVGRACSSSIGRHPG